MASGVHDRVREMGELGEEEGLVVGGEGGDKYSALEIGRSNRLN